MKEKNMQNKSIEIEKSQEKKTRAKGITLIALVVTIVILLILAGISINLVLGENGIISKAQESRLKSDNATVSDSLKMMIASYAIDDMGEGKTDVLARLNTDGITDANDVINVPVLVGKKLGTGNGSGTSDVYVIEDNKLYYYDKKGEKTDLGDIDNLQFSGDKQESGIFAITSDGTVYMKDRQYGFYIGNRDYSTKEVIIPSEINGIKVKKLGDYMFCNYSGLETVVIPDGVTEIGNGTFFGCWELRNINIPDGIEKIGDQGFGDCYKLENISIPESVQYIGKYALNSTKWWGSLQDGLIYINTILYEYKGKVPQGTTIEIKDGTTMICDEAFAGQNGLIDVKLPNSVKNIGEKAFYECSELTSVIIPDSVTSIGDNAFGNCTKLASITVPKNIKNISATAFDGTPFLNSPGAIYIGNTLYKYNDSEGEVSLTVKDGTERIEQNAFSDCKYLTSITMPNTVTEVGSYAFSNCINLSSVKLSSNINEIPNYTFLGCTSLNDIIIPDSVTSIGSYAFCNCTNLSSIKLSSNINEISNNTFSGCTSLNSIAIPENVVSISYSAFENCTSLSEITFLGDNIDYIDSTAFDNTAWLNNQNDGVVYIGKLLYCYKGEMPSNTTITVKGGTEAIEADAFAGKKELIEVVLPNSVKRIENGAFYECINLSSINIPENIEYIGSAAITDTAWFNEYLNNQKDALIYIGKCLLGYNGEDRSSITEITIKDGTTMICEGAFGDCANLTSITIPKEVNYIDFWAFVGCSNLKTINYKGSKEDWNNITIEIQAPDGSGITATINYNYK